MPETLRIGLLAGEASGDQLGAGLMDALRARRPAVRFVGVGGAAMRAEGLDVLMPSEALTTNGFLEPVRRLPEFLRLRRILPERFRAAGIDAFVGIDSRIQSFRRASLEAPWGPGGALRQSFVYAWRRGRVKTVAAAASACSPSFPSNRLSMRAPG